MEEITIVKRRSRLGPALLMLLLLVLLLLAAFWMWGDQVTTGMNSSLESMVPLSIQGAATLE